MNIFFVRGSGGRAHVVTPPLTGTILPGVTRDCVLTLAVRLGYVVEEAPVSVEEWTSGCVSGEITETFATGTAAGICPVGEIGSSQGTITVGGGTGGPIATALAQQLHMYHRGLLKDLPWISVVSSGRGGRAA
jgi:branched-chain amino acid aminotransferase